MTRKDYRERYEPKRKAAYAARKEAGLCIGNLSCAEPVAQTWRCERHYAMHREVACRAAAALYMRKKLAGICVDRRCHEPAQEHTVLCPKHEVALREGRDPRKARRARRRWYRKQKKARHCRNCGRGPLESKRHCETCLLKLRERSRARYLRLHPNARSTRNAVAVRGLDITAYLSSGASNLAGAQT